MQVAKDAYQPACRLVAGPRQPLLAVLGTVFLGLGWAIDKPTDALRRFPSPLVISLLPLRAGAEPLPVLDDEVVLFEWRNHHRDMCRPEEER